MANPNDPAILGEFGACNSLLQEFHRFDEDLSVKGKWQGGSVTGVCRGWGTNKFMSLEAMYHISDTVLGVEGQVEDCLQDIVDTFNSDPENFAVSDPCRNILEDDIGDPTFKFIFNAGGSLTVDRIVDDFQQKFDCLRYSFLFRSNFCPRDASCGMTNGQTT